MPFRIAEVEGSIPFESTIKTTTPNGCGCFYGNRGHFKCSAEASAGGTPYPQGSRAANGCAVNSTSAKVSACGKNACAAQTRRPAPRGSSPYFHLFCQHRAKMGIAAVIRAAISYLTSEIPQAGFVSATRKPFFGRSTLYLEPSHR